MQVRDKVFKVYKDDLKEWANGDKKDEVRHMADGICMCKSVCTA
jgi:hypothetical protein